MQVAILNSTNILHLITFFDRVYCDIVPRASENFLALCAAGAYDGLLFHRNMRGENNDNTILFKLFSIRAFNIRELS